jgi:catechol 2,3-dioxygenase-like lactoylglutathione lyase family enzyme
MTDWPGPISAITLFAEDVPATKSFYVEVFGLPVVYEDSASCVFRFGTQLINILDAAEAPGLIAPTTPGRAGTPPRFQFTLDVDDVDAAAADLARRGVVLLNGPMDREWGIRTALFADPTGSLWEIAAPLPQSAG